MELEKSTTLNLLLGFLNQDSGIINISNNIEHIGYIPENVNLYPYLTGIENLDYFSKIAGIKFTTDQFFSS